MEFSDKSEEIAEVPALNHVQANHYPLMRRFDQHFTVENKLKTYDSDINRLSALNKRALVAIERQEQRLKEIRNQIRPNRAELDRTTCNIELPSVMTPAADEMEPNDEPKTISTVLTNYGEKPQLKLEAKYPVNKRDRESESRAIETQNEVVPQINVASVSHDSFTLEWDVDKNCNPDNIFDVEIRYSCTVSGEERIVQHSCSQWALKQPVPKYGQLTVDNLDANVVEYRDVSIRFKSHSGWSDFTTPVRIICSDLGKWTWNISSINDSSSDSFISDATVANDYDTRRGQFMYRIEYIKRIIQGLKAERSAIPSKQKELALKMEKEQARLLELASETDRVIMIDDSSSNMISSPLLHGSKQVFTKSDLEQQLENERITCQSQIARWRADNIALDRERDDLASKIVQEATKLNERKKGLMRMNQQLDIVRGMKKIVSKQSREVMTYFFSCWKSRTAAAIEGRMTLQRLSAYIRRRIYLKAWRRLKGQNISASSPQKSIGGIGEQMVITAENCIINDHNDTFLVARSLAQSDSVNLLDQMVASLPCSSDTIGTIEKGMLYLRTELYQSCLKCFEDVMFKLSKPEQYFADLDTTTIIMLKALVLGEEARAYYGLEKYDAAIVLFDRQLSLAKEIHVHNIQINALLGLGKCYVKKSDFDYAHTLFQEAEILAINSEADAKEALEGIDVCLVNMNRPKEALYVEEKLDEMVRDKQKENVEAALSKIDTMKQRMFDIRAKQSRLVTLEVISTNAVLLKREKDKKQQLVNEYIESLSKSTENMEELIELEYALNVEIEDATTTKKARIVSRLINGSNQEVKTMELSRRLKGQLGVVKSKKDEAMTEINRIRMLIHNTKDEISRIDERIAIENGPLVKRILSTRNYRCMAMNKSNCARNDVSGTSKGCIELVASTEGQELFLHNITTGKLAFVFTGDSGKHIGEINGHTATITSIYFHGHYIYTGGMDCCVIGWCTRSMKKIFVGRGHDAAVTCISASRVVLVSGSADTSIILWKKDDGSLLRRIHGHARGIHHIISCSPSSKLELISASYDTLFCWKRDSSSTVRY